MSNNWTCSRCTFAGNTALFLTCSMCSSPRNKNNNTNAGLQQSTIEWAEAASNATQDGKRPSSKKKKRRLSAETEAEIGKITAIDLKAMHKIDDDDANNNQNQNLTGRSSSSSSNGKAKSATAVVKEEAAAAASEKNPAPPVPAQERHGPEHSVQINNLSDRQYCCVWQVEVYEDGYRPDVARMLLAKVARHLKPILRDRGWRVKRLIESASSSWIGLCTTNGRNDADAASANIQLNLRLEPSKHCRRFRSFHQILQVALHEITHISIGLEDIHPPAFFELLDDIKQEYQHHLTKTNNLEENEETEEYGTQSTMVTASGEVVTVERASEDILGPNFLRSSSSSSNNGISSNDSLSTGASSAGGKLLQDGECGAAKVKKRRRYRRGGGTSSYAKKSKAYSTSASNVPKKRPLLKGAKMIDGRTKAGRSAKAERESLSPRELAALKAEERLRKSQSEQIMATANHNDDDDDKAIRSNQANKENVVVDLVDSSEGEESDAGELSSDDEVALQPHFDTCGCRACEWDKMLFMPTKDENRELVVLE